MKDQGVLLVNLGSPDSPSVSDVRRYLREFLMDKRVLDAPAFIRFCVVHFRILPFRPQQSAEAYRHIWTPEGSPLTVISRRMQRKLQDRLPLHVEMAMRYQKPSLEGAIGRLRRFGVTELLVVPLFPHYAMSSYETAVERVKEVAGRLAPHIALKILPPFYNDPGYIAALVDSAEPHLRHGFDHLLFSFHGLPERHLRKADPTKRHCLKMPDCCNTPGPAHATCYRAQCLQTVRAFAAKAGIPEKKHSVAYQSRLGRDPWLTPYTHEEVVRLARQGVKRLAVICPAFTTDCLETLEEIGIRSHEDFLCAGGADFTLIPCLNDHPSWIAALETWTRRHLSIRSENQAGFPINAVSNAGPKTPPPPHGLPAYNGARNDG